MSGKPDLGVVVCLLGVVLPRRGVGGVADALCRRSSPASILLLLNNNGCVKMLGMVDTVYRLIPQQDGRISVEMAKPNGRRRIIPDFADEAEASAWIIQTKRLLQSTHPYPPGPRRKEGVMVHIDDRHPTDDPASTGKRQRPVDRLGR